MLSASNMPLPSHASHHDSNSSACPEGGTTVLLLPAFRLIDNVTPSTVPTLISEYINPAPTNTSPLATNGSAIVESAKPTPSPPSAPAPPKPSGLMSRPCPHHYLILLCSQKTRDARCGHSAPLLRKEFERHLRPLGLLRDLDDARVGGCGIYFISHVGGHKYSANVMVYRRQSASPSRDEVGSNADDRESEGGQSGEAAQCIWLARVRPEDCENIVKFTLLQGKVVKPDRQLRGGFDREKGLVSW